jgi:hypothetical protein
MQSNIFSASSRLTVNSNVIWVSAISYVQPMHFALTEYGADLDLVAVCLENRFRQFSILALPSTDLNASTSSKLVIVHPSPITLDLDQYANQLSGGRFRIHVSIPLARYDT